MNQRQLRPSRQAIGAGARLFGILMGGFCLGIPLQGYAGPTAPPEPELRDLLLRSVDAADSFEHPYDAEVWLLDMSSRLSRIVPSDAERLELLRMVHAEARRAKLSPELVLAVIEVESRFDRFAISVAGAQGLMQIMPFWLKEIGHPQDNLFIVQTNLRMGCTILKYYLDREKGNLVQALARYNGSLGRLEYPGKVIEVLNKRWYRG
nr:lytic transglycosylase domain-containing protein [Sinimarinibacterium sp. CAU 1509]